MTFILLLLFSGEPCMNYQALTIQAAELAESGQYAELEVICQKILNKKPKHFDAL